MKLESFDLVETKNGLIFVVYGTKHKRGFIRGFLRFYPSEDGHYIYRGRNYEKMKTFFPEDSQLKELLEGYSTDPFGGPNVYWIPQNDILKIHNNRNNLKFFLKGSNPYKEYLKRFLLILGLNLDDLGMTGSMSIGMSPPKGHDFDLVIRSEEERRQLLKSILDKKILSKIKNLGMRLVTKAESLENAKRLSRLYKIPVKSTYEVMMKDHLKFFSTEGFYIGFVMNPLADERFNLPKESLTEKIIVLKGIIIDDSGRFANPRRYLIKADYNKENTKEWQGKSFWVFTYLHLFKNVGPVQDRVMICGMLGSRSNVYLVRQGDYILPI